MEYILHEAQEPNLFVIRKQKRDGPEKVTALAAYYVLDGSIYQAPQLYNVIGSRVVCPQTFRKYQIEAGDSWTMLRICNWAIRTTECSL